MKHTLDYKKKRKIKIFYFVKINEQKFYAKFSSPSLYLSFNNSSTLCV